MEEMINSTGLLKNFNTYSFSIKDEIKIIKDTSITLKKAYSTYLSTSFEKNIKKTRNIGFTDNSNTVLKQSENTR